MFSFFFFLSNFLIIVFNIFFIFNIYHSPTFLSPLPFHLPTTSLIFLLSYLLISSLPSTLISLFLFPFIFLYFCLFLFTPFYYKFVTISFILFIVFPHQKKVLSLSPSLSLSLSNFFGGFFLFFLHLYFRLIIFYIF